MLGFAGALVALAPDRPEPPPFDPDPELITHLERGDKPTREEVRAVAERRR